MARNEIVEAMQKMKSRKTTGPYEGSVEMIVASGENGVKVMMELCQRVLDGREIPDATSVIVPIFKGKSSLLSILLCFLFMLIWAKTKWMIN